MKAMILVCLVITLAACGPSEEPPRDSDGRRILSINELCLDGVVYYGQYLEYQHGFLAPKFDTSGNIVTCDENTVE